MKRIAILLLLISTLSTGLAQDAETNAIDYMIYHGGGPHNSWDNRNIRNYKSDNPGVNIARTSYDVYRYTPAGPLGTLDEQLTSDNPPDVYSGFMGGAFFRPYIEQGLIADITELWVEMGWYEVFPQNLIDRASYNGRQYFVPQAVQWSPVWYRISIFEELNLTPPTGWEELLATCDTLHEAGYTPFAVSSDLGSPMPMTRWFTILNKRLNGPEFHEDLMAGVVSYDDPRIENVFVHWRTLFEHNCFPDDDPGWNQAVRDYVGKDAAMYFLGEWLFEFLSPSSIRDTSSFRFPALDEAVPNGEITGVYGAFIHANTDNMEASLDLLRYFASVESQLSNAEINRRVTASLEIDPTVYPEYQQDGLQFILETGHDTELLEFTLFNQDMVRTTQQILHDFWIGWAQPEIIQQTMTALEEARLELLETGG